MRYACVSTWMCRCVPFHVVSSTKMFITLMYWVSNFIASDWKSLFDLTLDLINFDSLPFLVDQTEWENCCERVCHLSIWLCAWNLTTFPHLICQFMFTIKAGLAIFILHRLLLWVSWPTFITHTMSFSKI